MRKKRDKKEKGEVLLEDSESFHEKDVVGWIRTRAVKL